MAATVRWVSYRRLRGRFADYFNLLSLGVIIVIILSWLVASLMSFLKQPYYRDKRGYGSPPLGVRTGLMAFALIPLILATAGKVNIITWLTGLGHEKLNVFHRWTAYLMLYLSVIHTIPFIVQPLREGGIEFLRERWYHADSLEYNGTPTLGMLFGLAVLSLPPLRRLAYELFVQVHNLLLVVFLGLCFWHADQEGDSWAYLWATLGILLFQIIFRWFGKTSWMKPKGHWFTQAPVLITTLGENMLRLDIAVKGRWTWEPGQHVFLRFATLRLLDNHPFTIACVPEYNPVGDESRMVVFIRPQKGMTARISSIAGSSTNVGVTLDGPYGTIIRPKVEMRYDTVILIAGGGGISGVLPWLQHLTKHLGERMSVVRSVTLIWAVRSRASLSWLSKELDAILSTAPEGSLRLDIWITGQSEKTMGSACQLEDKETAISDLSLTTSNESNRGLPVSHCGQRPIMSEVTGGYVSKGRTMIIGCGPESLKMDLSNAVATSQLAVLRGEAKEIRLHTETFGW